MKRVGQVIGLREDQIESYKSLHREVWDEVLDRLQRSNIQNYSIFLRRLRGGETYLFSYFEYVGNDYEADMLAISKDPKTQDWWKLTEPMQKPLPDRELGDWWANMEEVFHQG